MATTAAILDLEHEVRTELEGVRREARALLDPGRDVHEARALLAERLPALVQGRARLLLETLLNALMQDARRQLEGAPAAMQNRFFDLDLRGRVQAEAAPVLPVLPGAPPADPRQAPLAAGAVLAGGVLLAVLAPVPALLRVLALLAVGAAAVLAHRAVRDRAALDARRALEADVEAFFAQMGRQLLAHLRGAEQTFGTAFDRFREENR